MPRTVLTLLTGLTLLAGCKSYQSGLSEEDNLNDPTLEPAYQAAMQRLNQPFALGVTHVDPDGCLRTWLERLMGERYAGKEGESVAGVNLWNTTPVAVATNDSRGKIKKIYAEFELAKIDYNGEFDLEDRFFLADYRDLDNRLVLAYELDVVAAPNLIRNFLILTKNFRYFEPNARKFEENYLSRIEAKTIDYLACQAQMPQDVSSDDQTRLRSPEGVGEGDDSVRLIDYVYRELIAKRFLRHLSLTLRFTENGVNLPFIGSKVANDPYLMPISVTDQIIQKGDLVQFQQSRFGRVEATKIGFYPLASAEYWPENMAVTPVRIGTYLGDRQDGLHNALVKAIQDAQETKRQNDADIQIKIDEKIGSGESLTPSQVADLQQQNRRFSEIIIKNIRINTGGAQEIHYEGHRMPQINQQ